MERRVKQELTIVCQSFPETITNSYNYSSITFFEEIRSVIVWHDRTNDLMIFF